MEIDQKETAIDQEETVIDQEETAVEQKNTEPVPKDTLLEQIASQQQLVTKLHMISACACSGIFLVLLIAALILVPKASRSLNLFDGAVDDLHQAVDEARETIKGIDTLTDTAQKSLTKTSKFVENANQVITDNAEGITEVIDNFNSVDFAKLNQAIEDLSSVIEPLAN